MPPASGTGPFGSDPFGATDGISDTAEVVHAADSVDCTIIYATQVAEAVHAADTPAATEVTSAALSENVHAADTPVGSAHFAVALAEAAHVVDSPAAAVGLVVTIAEHASVADMAVGGLIFSKAVAESTHPVDQVAPFKIIFPVVQEVVYAVDSPANTSVFPLSVEESVLLTDAPNAVVMPLPTAIMESVALVDSVAGVRVGPIIGRVALSDHAVFLTGSDRPMNQYIAGNIVEIDATFADWEGNPVDPTDVTGQIHLPDGTTVDLTFQLITTGKYTATYTPLLSGLYRYRAAGDGVVIAANEGAFTATTAFAPLA